MLYEVITLFHRGQDSGLVGKPHTDDEGKIEAFAVGRVERVEPLELFRAQPIKSG